MSNVNEFMRRNYRISLRWDEEEGLYFASVDDLPGCLADGRTANKAVENLREAMKSWMSSRIAAGLEIPEPKETSDYSGKILVRMPKSLHKKLSAQAASEGVSLNQHIVSALSEACGRASAVEPQNIATLQGYNVAHIYEILTAARDTLRMTYARSNAIPLFYQPLALTTALTGWSTNDPAQRIGTGIGDISWEPVKPAEPVEREAAPAA